MSPIDRFNSFAADFEACVADNHWDRLEAYFDENARYWNLGGPDPSIEGREAILNFLKNDVSNNDRKFDSRTLEALTEPMVVGNKLSRNWRCTYKLAGAPDLVVEGEARYEFEGELISSLEEEITPDSLQRYVEWMEKYSSRLPA
ncbi:MAG: nuclear transport factor 2 family protein [Candidatus Thiodiazotropha sp.]